MSTSSRFLSIALMASLALVSFAPNLEAAEKRTTTFAETMSADDLLAAYATAQAGGDKVRILIMPGHEPEYGGAQFMGFYERELVVGIADQLATELRTDSNFEVLVARGNQGWNTDLERYFHKQGKKISSFVQTHKKEMKKLERRGRLEDAEEQAAHNAAPDDVALRLYGVSKWANENDVDLVLHLHLNDDTAHAAEVRGVESGLAIYVPDSVYGNSKASEAIAEPIFARLQATNATSTSGVEQKGIVEDRELIAIGAYNTAEMPSLLIEYGYLYEPRITGEGARDEVFADYAYQTAQGVKDFFGSPGRPRFDTRVLPYTFSTDPVATSSSPRSVYALQAALSDLGLYPGTEASLATCPISGITNVCVEAAVKAFQASKGLEQTGTLGPSTRSALNAAFGLSTPIIAQVPTAPPAATTNSCAAFTSTLAPESTDAETSGEVTRLQQILAKDTAVYPEGKVTGYFGPATLAAVKRFQLKNTLTTKTAASYGLVGPVTKAALVTSCSTAMN